MRRRPASQPEKPHLTCSCKLLPHISFPPPPSLHIHLQSSPRRRRQALDTSNIYFMEDSSCNKAAPELLDSCYVWIYSMLGWNKFLSAHCVCGCLCYIPPGVTLYHETVCNYVFTRPSPLSLFVSFWFFVCVRAISPSSDPGLSGDAGPGARGVCQPPLPRRRHPESQTPLVEERHGPAAQILQTALSHRWGVFKCCRQRMRSGRYCLPHLIGAVLQTNSAAVRQHCRDLFFFKT